LFFCAKLNKIRVKETRRSFAQSADAAYNSKKEETE